ncbi:MAG TPA: hypothetical protein V6C84_21455 [Coleofasciculaceae cyanobacterium]|jgi:hypothetical protein
MIPAPQPESVACAAQFTPHGSDYRDRLLPWCIILQLPKMQRVVVSRHRQRSEAEAHLKILRQLSPASTYVLVFDPPNDQLL